jgi:hypothetical protein
MYRVGCRGEGGGLMSAGVTTLGDRCLYPAITTATVVTGKPSFKHPRIYIMIEGERAGSRGSILICYKT